MFTRKTKIIALAFVGIAIATNTPFAKSRLTRIAVTRLRAEITGMYATSEGDFVLNVQHLKRKIPSCCSKVAIDLHLTEFFFGNAAHRAASRFQQT